MCKNRSYFVAFWSPFSASEPNPCILDIAAGFRRYGDIRCLDCMDNQDPRTRLLLHHSDLVVITLRQNRRELCDLFCKCGVRFPNCVWLITDYVPDDSLSLRRIAYEFRIPTDRLACIPYSPRLREGIKWSGTDHLSPEFHRDVDRAGLIMLRALGF